MTRTVAPWSAVLFSFTPLMLSHVPAAVRFHFDSNAAATLGMDRVPIPVWVFTAVWSVAYPGMGLAAWFVWRRRTELDPSVPIALLGASFLITLSFWLTNSLRMTATLDAVNLVLAWTTVWVFSRYSRAAMWCLMPWAVWMPVTLAFKVSSLSQ